MDPAAPSQPPSQEPTPTSPPPAPSPPPAIQQAPMMNSVSPTPTAPTGKSHKRLIIGIIAAALVVFVLPFVLLFLLAFMKNAQALGASNAFMKAITSKNVDAAVSASDTSDDAAGVKSFLTQASVSVEGSYKLSQSKLDNNKGYYLYNLTNSTNKYARTVVEKQASGWKVTSFVYSPTALALVPKASTASSASSTAKTTAPASTSSAACLTEQDAASISDDEMATTEVLQGYFNPNSAQYAYPDVTNPQFQKLGDFYKSHASAKFTFHVVVSEYQGSSASASDQALAAQRESVVKAGLTDAGVPADYIAVDSPYLQPANGSDPSTAVTYRNFAVKLDTTCSLAQ